MTDALLFLRLGAVGTTTTDRGVVADFPWAEIAKGKDAIIDVGGGQGTLCCSLAVKYVQWRTIIDYCNLMFPQIS
jgi:hypothetical protein